MANFSLEQQANLERPTFELTDGTEIEFRMRIDFTASDAARMQKISSTLGQLSKRLQKSPDDGRLVAKYDELYDRFVLILLPEFPSEVLATLTTGMKIQIVNFWTQEQKKLDGERDPLDFLLD